MVDSRDEGDDTIVHPTAEAEGPSTESSGRGTAGWRELAVVVRDRYETRDRIAAGGVGRIVSAYDRRLDREVAIKELHEGSDPAATERFVREALLTAKLQHPNIVPVYEAGRWPTGEPFFAMKLVEGRPLSTAIAQATGLGERLALLPHVIDCAQAVAFAHSEGVIHRDLKPANVLVGSFGETVVIDWGLAKRIDDGRPDESSSLSRAPIDGDPESLTVTGAVIGTPAYMSPEQAAGSRVDARADVYAIGALLYHLLAGHSPYVGGAWIEVVAHVVLGPPPPIESLERNVPHELAAIVAKAMARDPEARYRDAGELLVDLRAFQDGRIVGAHRYSAWQRTLRFVKRFRTAVAAAAVLVVVGSYALVSSLVAQRQLTIERDAAAAASDEAERARHEAIVRSDESTLQRARTVAHRIPNHALALLDTLSDEFTRWGAAQVVAADAHAHGSVAYLRRCGDSDPSPTRCPRASVRNVAFAADGTVIATHADGRIVRHHATTGAVLGEPLDVCDAAIAHEVPAAGGLLIGCRDGSVRWSTASGVHELGHHDGAVYAMVTTPDGRAFTMGYDRALWMWELPRGPGRALARCEQPGQLGRSPFAISGDGRVAACLGSGAVLEVFDVEGGVRERGPAVEALLLALDRTGERLAWGTSDRGGGLWDRSTGAQLELWRKSGVSALGLAADGARVVMGSQGGDVRVWDAIAKREYSLLAHTGTVAALGFLADDELVSVGGEGEAHRVRLGGGRSLVIAGGVTPAVEAAIDEHTGRLAVQTSSAEAWLWGGAPREPVILREPVPLAVLAASDDPDRVMIGTEAGELLEVSLERGLLRRLRVGEAAVRTIAVGRHAIAGGDADGTVVVWDRDGNERARHVGEGNVAALDFDAREDRLVIVHGFRDALVLAIAGGTTTAVKATVGAPTFALFLPDGRLLVSSGRGELAVLSAELAVERVDEVHRDEIWRLVANADETVVVSVGRDERIVLHDVAAGTHRPIDAPFGAFDAHFIAGGAELLLRSRDYSLRRLDLERGTIARVYVGHGGHIEVFDAMDGAPRFASGSVDDTLRIWDIASGEHRILSGHTDSVSGVLVRPSRHDVISIGRDGTVRRWIDDVPADEHGLRQWLAHNSDDVASEFE